MAHPFEVAFKVTSWFECGDDAFGEVSGNFDGQGVSWGPRQTNFGQGTLQPVLKKAIADLNSAVQTAFGPLYGKLLEVVDAPTVAKQTQMAIEIMNDADNHIRPEWAQAFKTLGQNPEMQNIFVDEAAVLTLAVEGLNEWLMGGKPTLRSYCLCFDIVTQNGNVGKTLRMVLTLAKPILTPFSKDVRDWMRVIAWSRAAWSYILGNRDFALDVLARKLLIIEGKGKFRGERVDLDARFGITDEAC